MVGTASRTRSKPQHRQQGPCGWQTRTCSTAAGCFGPKMATSCNCGRCRWMWRTVVAARVGKVTKRNTSKCVTPGSARRSLHARRYLAKRDAVSVAEVCDLIYALAAEARSVGNLTRYSPTSWCRAGVQTLIESLNSVLAVHQAICGAGPSGPPKSFFYLSGGARPTLRVRPFRKRSEPLSKSPEACRPGL